MICLLYKVWTKNKNLILIRVVKFKIKGLRLYFKMIVFLKTLLRKDFLEIIYKEVYYTCMYMNLLTCKIKCKYYAL